MYCLDNIDTPAFRDLNMSICLPNLAYLPFQKTEHSKFERKNVFCGLTAPVGHVRTLNDQALCFNRPVLHVYSKFCNISSLQSASAVRPMRSFCFCSPVNIAPIVYYS